MAEQDYALIFAWASSIPEIADLQRRWEADNKSWPKDRIQAELEKTQWWRTQQASQRQWAELQGSDPAQAAYLADQKYRELWAIADELGVQVTDEWLKGWTDMALRYGWSPAQGRKVVADAWQLYQYADTGGIEGQRNVMGAGGSTLLDINRLAGEYSTTLDDDTKQAWARQILAGTTTIESYQAYLAQSAAADNPWMKSGLDQGFTVKQLLNEYVSRAAQELGITTGEIDLTDPKWRQLVEVTDEKGERIRPNTQTILKIIRNDERFGFDKTDTALSAATDLNVALTRMFGAVG